MLAAADQEAGPEFGERDGVGLDVLLVDLGIVHVHAGDPVSLRHRQTPSTRTISISAAPSRSARAA